MESFGETSLDFSVIVIIYTLAEYCPYFVFSSSNISLQQNMISTIGKKLINLQGLPTCPKFGEL